MLSEVINVKQIADEPRRRWFASATLDLFLWYDDDENIIQFQICYDKGPEEKALTWHHQKGTSHHSVDDGENQTFRMKGTPIMINDGEFNVEEIALRFEELADNLEYKTVQFVLSYI